mmetsp:Transcript_20154/g.34985  ORF Transcript_20154/g.34985 Transcript_20154/m.34985 type:complete len:392 (+) Transcript_20154:1087-2262(+)
MLDDLVVQVAGLSEGRGRADTLMGAARVGVNQPTQIVQGHNSLAPTAEGIAESFAEVAEFIDRQAGRVGALVVFGVTRPGAVRCTVRAVFVDELQCTFCGVILIFTGVLSGHRVVRVLALQGRTDRLEKTFIAHIRIGGQKGFANLWHLRESVRIDHERTILVRVQQQREQALRRRVELQLHRIRQQGVELGGSKILVRGDTMKLQQSSVSFQANTLEVVVDGLGSGRGGPAGLQQVAGLVHTPLRRVGALEEITLQRCHGQFIGWQARSKLSGQRCFAGIKTQKHTFHLVFGGEFQLQLHVAAARADQRRIEAFNVICRHEQQSSFLGSHTVEGVQQATEGHAGAAATFVVAVFGRGGALHEDSIHILENDDAVVRRVAQVFSNSVIGEP